MQNPIDMLAKLGSGDDEDKSGPKPSIPYWHLWTDDTGISHQAQCALTAFELKGVGCADPQWNNKHATHPSTVVITVQPVGWVGDWHGTRIEQGPGEFSFGEDQGCTMTDGKKGHRSGTIGDEPAVLMTVQLHIDPRRTPCHVI